MSKRQKVRYVDDNGVEGYPPSYEDHDYPSTEEHDEAPDEAVNAGGRELKVSVRHNVYGQIDLVFFESEIDRVIARLKKRYKPDLIKSLVEKIENLRPVSV